MGGWKCIEKGIVDYLDLIPREDCTGCSACASACPAECVSLAADERGFLHPVLDQSKCIDCGLCKRVCPVLNEDSFKSPAGSHFFSCKHRDDEVRRNSSSGGFFYELANTVISEGGVVCGARFSSDYKKVYHSLAFTFEEFQPMRVSKYVQSEMRDTYHRVRDVLKTGKKVLFTGTPCQVAGLKAFLMKDYDNLISVEVVCHGVPSQKVWDIYLTDLEKEHGANVSFVTFRDKSNSWHNSDFRVDFENGMSFIQPNKNNPYMKSFLNDLNIRESCTRCRFKRFASGADITMGDFWGSTELGADYSDDIGISIISIHSERGQECFDTIRDRLCGIQSLDEQVAYTFNESYALSTTKNPNSDLFFEGIERENIHSVINATSIDNRGTNKRNPAVDIAKFIAALFVIGIHTRPLLGLSELGDFFLVDILFRTAVPFFAVCTGFYLSKGLEVPNRWKSVLRRARYIFCLYVFWSLLYLILLEYTWQTNGLHGLSYLFGWAKSFIIGSSYYHLWYLAQLFWALLFFYPIARYVPFKCQIIIAICLWLFGSYAYVYSEVTDMSNCFIDFYNQFGSITGSLGRMLPLLLVGSFANKMKGLKTKYVSILLLVCFIGLVVEAFLLKSLGATKFSFIVFTFPLAFFLFVLVERLIVNIRFNTRYLAKASMNVYLIHPAIIFILKEIGILSPIALFVLTCVFSVFLCLSVVYIGNNCKGSFAK